MALVSPGVEVNVIDESFYTPAAAGTVPMIFVATASNKTSSTGSGIAPGTLKSNAGKAYLLTSQRELGETFGDPVFYSDNNGNMIHGSELNEYGLQTAYSLLGVTNRAYVVRADLDLGDLTASATAPGGEPNDGAWWFDTQVTDFGILEWNAAPVTTTGGQSFTSVTPIVLTAADVSRTSGESLTAPGAPKESVGQIGDYAVVAITTMNRLWYKNPSNTWVEVGSDSWKSSWPVVASSGTFSLSVTDTFTVNGASFTPTLNDTATEVASEINGRGIVGVSAAAVNGILEIYADSTSASNGVDADGRVALTGTGLTAMGITVNADGYAAPELAIAPHTLVPEFKSTDLVPAPTGSIWIKTTEPNGGAKFNVKQYNSDTQLWQAAPAPLHETAEAALYSLDPSGGGENIATGRLYVKVNVNEDDPKIGSYKLFRRAVQGATIITTKKITSGTLEAASAIEFTIKESTVGSGELSADKVISFTASGESSDADTLAAAINSANLTNVSAEVDSQDRVVIRHKTGGEIRFVDTNGSLEEVGFVPYSASNPGSMVNLSYAPGITSTTPIKAYTASNWRVLSYEAQDDEPLQTPEDGRLWYSSVVDEVDIMINNGTTWVGYHNFGSNSDCSPAGPIVSASEPDHATGQSDGSPLTDGDIWISTADIENFPMIYRYNGTLQEFTLLDKTDQTTENGVLFADARWATAGTSDEASDIDELLTSNYLDPDAPDPALYPKGMIMWNLRRSGFNVKQYRRNYIDLAGDNIRQNDDPMADYAADRWVTISGNNEDGSGTFGRHAQRKSVTQALQAMVNSNQDIRDEESRQFNLIATPGYPELIGEMISLNYDRRLTAFVVADVPARLTPDATSLNEWATNVRSAVEDNDNGAVSFDEYLGMYWGWGFTSDNAGNNVVVPPSHMALRTLILNDQVAYPWFAPAGTRRGGVTNATATGYITSEGEFLSVALNTGQRDTLYSNSINPITFLGGSGLVVFGQKTRARNASALDRINVARLVVYMRGQLERLARPYLFEPNDKITRDQIRSAAEGFCLELVNLRGLYDFLVVCDESNNTPERIDRNELYLDIAIEPVKAIEFIYIPLRIKNTGEIAALG